MNQNKETSFLVEFLLTHVKKRPAMYLGEAKISRLATFLAAYNIGFHAASEKLDHYFGENGFQEWYLKKYNLQRTSFWEAPFLDQTKNDEEDALKLYFENLELYNTEIHQN